MKKYISLWACLVFLGMHFQANAQKNQRMLQYNLEKGLAIEGYDPVTYFTLGKAMEGKKSNSLTYEGVTYYFSSATNKELFNKDPRKYEPQYGGWCAYALGEKNEKVDIDPETFKIINGKLYLFFNAWGNNTLTKWNKNESKLKVAADKNWQAIYQ
jgi:YHS domain-containing protein